MSEHTNNQSSNPLSGFLAGLQAAWAALLQGVIWLGGIIAGFLLPPQFEGRIVGGSISVENLSRLVQLVLAVLIGLVFVATRRSRPRRSPRFWMIWAVVLLFLAFGAYYLYLNLLDSWTCSYAGTKVVTGSDLTPHGAEYMQTHMDRSCRDWINDHIGEVEEIWTSTSIWRREVGLLLSYILAVPLFAFCIMSLLQGIVEAVRQKQT